MEITAVEQLPLPRGCWVPFPLRKLAFHYRAQMLENRELSTFLEYFQMHPRYMTVCGSRREHWMNLCLLPMKLFASKCLLLSDTDLCNVCVYSCAPRLSRYGEQRSLVRKRAYGGHEFARLCWLRESYAIQDILFSRRRAIISPCRFLPSYLL